MPSDVKGAGLLARGWLASKDAAAWEARLPASGHAGGRHLRVERVWLAEWAWRLAAGGGIPKQTCFLV